MSKQQWFYVDAADDQQGPITSKKLQVLANSGTIKPETLVWTEEIDEKWIAARNVTGLFPDKSVQPPAHPATRPPARPGTSQGAAVQSTPPAPAASTPPPTPPVTATPLASAFQDNTPPQPSPESPAIRASAVSNPAATGLLPAQPAGTALLAASAQPTGTGLLIPSAKPVGTSLLTASNNPASMGPSTVPLLRANKTVAQPPQAAQEVPQVPQVVSQAATQQTIQNQLKQATQAKTQALQMANAQVQQAVQTQVQQVVQAKTQALQVAKAQAKQAVHAQQVAQDQAQQVAQAQARQATKLQQLAPNPLMRPTPTGEIQAPGTQALQNPGSAGPKTATLLRPAGTAPLLNPPQIGATTNPLLATGPTVQQVQQYASQQAQQYGAQQAPQYAGQPVAGQVAGQAASPYQAPGTNPQAPQLGGKYPATIKKGASFGQWLFCLVLGFILIGAGGGMMAKGSMPDQPMIPMVLAGIGAVFVIATLLMIYVYLYRAWKCLQPAGASVGPAAAVGLLFIPIFNIYWIFKALGGLPRQWNTITASYDNTKHAPKLSIGAFICLIFIPIIGTIIWVAQVTKGLNFMKGLHDQQNMNNSKAIGGPLGSPTTLGAKR